MHAFNSSNKRGKFIRILVLIIGLMLPFFLVSFGLPVLSESLGAAPYHQVIRDSGIDAGAWFWIFVEEFSEILPMMRHQLEFTPGGRPGSVPAIEQIENYYYLDQYVLE